MTEEKKVWDPHADNAPGWVVRLVEEIEELQRRTDSLANLVSGFTGCVEGVTVEGLSSTQKSLLFVQLATMQAYCVTLTSRLQDYKDNGPCEMLIIDSRPNSLMHAKPTVRHGILRSAEADSHLKVDMVAPASLRVAIEESSP